MQYQLGIVDRQYQLAASPMRPPSCMSGLRSQSPRFPDPQQPRPQWPLRSNWKPAATTSAPPRRRIRNPRRPLGQRRRGDDGSGEPSIEGISNLRSEASSNLRMKLRVYTDTSVIGGCLDPEFGIPSVRLMEHSCRRSYHRFVRIDTFGARRCSRKSSASPEQIPEEHREHSALTAEAMKLADLY